MRNRSNGGNTVLPGFAVGFRGWPTAVLSMRFAAGLLLAAVLASGGAARAQEATLVVDANTGSILYSDQPDKQLHPASLTKIMTIYMAFEALRENRLKPDQRLGVSRHAAAQPPSKLRLKKGTTIKAKDAILALITKSANDVAVVLAEAMAGTESEFARAMTVQALKLGMTDTVFRNASGLHDKRQITTARDMGKLAMALLRDYPNYYKQFATRSFSWHGRRYANHNPLLSSYKGADGIKTGYIRQSGYNLVGSAARDGQRIIAVVLGGKTTGIRNWTMTTLLDYGFDRIGAVPATTKTNNLAYIANPTGEKAIRIALGGAADTTITARRNGPRTANAPAVLAAATTPVAARQLASTIGPNWAVQVGAYPSTPPAETAARKAKAKIPGLLGNSRLSLPPVTRNGSLFYRARLVGLTEGQARSACRRLADHAIPCLAIGDDGDFKTGLIQ